MRQLIAVSSLLEIKPFLEKYITDGINPDRNLYRISDSHHVLISGIGCPRTIFNLTGYLNDNRFDRVIQAGIAGSYNSSHKPGKLLEVTEDVFADLGIDDNGRFLTIEEAGLEDSDNPAFHGGRFVNKLKDVTGLPLARSITVNTVSGSEKLISMRKAKFNPDIESMEGAAAFYVCMSLKIPVLQVRAVSNMVEPRDKSSWNINIAVEKLNNWLDTFVNP